MENKGELVCAGGWAGAGAWLLLAMMVALPAAARADGVTERVAVASSNTENCRVLVALDATTLRLRCDGGERVLALRGVRAPRPGTPAAGGEPYGSEARAQVGAWLTGRDLEIDTRSGAVRADGVDVRAALLAAGLASCVDDEIDAASGVAMHTAEHAARAGGRGMWSYEAWRRYELARTAPVELTAAPPTAPPEERESLGAVARRAGQASFAERKAAFDAALAVAASTHVRGAAAQPPALTIEAAPATVTWSTSRSSAREAARIGARQATARASTERTRPSPRARRGSASARANGDSDEADDGPIVTCSPLGRELCLPARESRPERSSVGSRSARGGGHRARAPRTLSP